MSGLVQCNTCLAFVFRGTFWKLGCCPICMQISSLRDDIACLNSLVCALQSEIRRFSKPVCSVELPCKKPPLPQRLRRRRAVWTTVGSGRVRHVDHKHVAFGLALHNPYSVLSELEADTKAANIAACEIGNPSLHRKEELEKKIAIPKVIVLSEVDNQESVVDKAPKGRSHLLVGDSIVRGVALGNHVEVSKEVRCLPGATVRRDKRRILKIVKKASEECNVDVVVHLGTNDLSQNDVRSVQKDFQNLGQDLQQLGCTVTFSEVLPVHNGQHEKVLRIAEFNVWLKDWCKAEGFGYVSHDAIRWSDIELYKRDGLHPSHKGTELLGMEFRNFLDMHLN